MNQPKIRICDELPDIAVPEDPIVLYNGSKLMLCYETTSGDNTYAVISFGRIIEYKLTPINDEGFGKYKYAKYGMKPYSIHEIKNIDETLRWQISEPKYWVFCFKDRTFEALGTDLIVIKSSCDKITMEHIITDFFDLPR